MEIQRGDIASVAVLVCRKCVDYIWIAMWKWFWGLKCSIRYERSVVWQALYEIRWAMGLPLSQQVK